MKMGKIIKKAARIHNFFESIANFINLCHNLMNMDDEMLNKLAVEALLEEAKLGAQRAEIMGPTGWIKPRETVNKRFLHSTLRNVVISNKHRSMKKDKISKVQTSNEDKSVNK